jgi:hypothetical protein
MLLLFLCSIKMHNVFGERSMIFSEPHFDQRELHLSFSVCLSETEACVDKDKMKGVGNMELPIHRQK